MAQLRVEKLLETLSGEGLYRLSEKITSKKRDTLSRLYQIVRKETLVGGKLEEKKRGFSSRFLKMLTPKNSTTYFGTNIACSQTKYMM
jgi:hypothetical protein